MESKCVILSNGIVREDFDEQFLIVKKSFQNCLTIISEFVVSSAEHCGKAGLGPSGIKPDILTLAPMGACVKPSSRKLNHIVFTISALTHRRCDSKESYFPVNC